MPQRQDPHEFTDKEKQQVSYKGDPVLKRVVLFWLVFYSIIATVLIWHDSRRHLHSSSSDSCMANDVGFTTAAEIMSGDDMSDLLQKRVTWSTAATAGATTLFGSLLADVVWGGPLGTAMAPYIGQAGVYIVGSLCAAATTMFGTYSGANTWEWWKGSGTAGDK